jgi:hypothetical protein
MSGINLGAKPMTFEASIDRAVEVLGNDDEFLVGHVMRKWAWTEDRRCYGNPEEGFPWFQAYSHLGGAAKVVERYVFSFYNWNDSDVKHRETLWLTEPQAREKVAAWKREAWGGFDMLIVTDRSFKTEHYNSTTD